jgi:hypothetical protein
MYKLFNDNRGNVEGVQRTTDGACIPMNPDNTDYQAYLKWVEAGNTPEPADEQGA